LVLVLFRARPRVYPRLCVPLKCCLCCAPLSLVVRCPCPLQIFWTPGMRGELLQFIQARVEDGAHTGDMDAQSALMFSYKTLADELILGGVYIKHFLADPAMSLDDPYLLCHDLLVVRSCLFCRFTPSSFCCAPWPAVCVVCVYGGGVSALPPSLHFLQLLSLCA
jgi:hypothetical protein